MERITNEYLRGFKDCLTEISEQLNFTTKKYLSDRDVTLPLMAQAWNDMAAHVEWLKIQVLNMNDEATVLGKVLPLKLVKEGDE